MTFLLPVIEKKYFNLAGSANKNASKKKTSFWWRCLKK